MRWARFSSLPGDPTAHIADRGNHSHERRHLGQYPEAKEFFPLVAPYQGNDGQEAFSVPMGVYFGKAAWNSLKLETLFHDPSIIVPENVAFSKTV